MQLLLCNVADFLKVSEADAAELLIVLERLGYVRVHSFGKVEGDRADPWMHYEPDNAGLALKKARFSKPLRRATAERLAAEIQARAGRAARHRFAYEIVEVHLFGSAADPTRANCGDVDSAVSLTPATP
jgi:hypothetical protein